MPFHANDYHSNLLMIIQNIFIMYLFVGGSVSWPFIITSDHYHVRLSLTMTWIAMFSDQFAWTIMFVIIIITGCHSDLLYCALSISDIVWLFQSNGFNMKHYSWLTVKRSSFPTRVNIQRSTKPTLYHNPFVQPILGDMLWVLLNLFFFKKKHFFKENAEI